MPTRDTVIGRHLVHDLDTIGQWSGHLPIDTSRHRNTYPPGPGPRTAAPTEPCDPTALDHSQRITLAEAVIKSTCNHWLWNQASASLPAVLAGATPDELDTTAARCVILRANLAVLLTNPNIAQISLNLAEAAEAIQWARDEGRLAD